jgi:hypothetical protein
MPTSARTSLRFFGQFADVGIRAPEQYGRRFGVKEYWIGDPANKALENLTLKEGRYE